MPLKHSPQHTSWPNRPRWSLAWTLDAADAAIEAPLPKIDPDELQAFAHDLEAEGATHFEALGYASTLLK